MMRRFLLSLCLVFVALNSSFGDELYLQTRGKGLETTRYSVQKSNTSYYFTEWCGLGRVVKVSKSVDSRLRAYELELAKEKLSESRLFQILVSMSYIYSYEFKSEEDYDAVMGWLSELANTYKPARFELLFSRLKSGDILSYKGNKILHELLSYDTYFPYDNGYLPRVEKDYLTLMAAISDMALGRETNLDISEHFFGFRGLSVDMLYDFAFDRKDRGYLKFIDDKSGDDVARNMLAEVLEPMYMPIRDVERRFLAGLAASELFPHVATELFVDCLTGRSRMAAVEHGLGVLVNHYRGIGAFSESVEVSKSLLKYYPNSGWLKNE